jgi:hypothetical protein
LDHWVNVSGRPLPQRCAATTCAAKPQLGAHVQLEYETENYWYIIPVCLKHSISAPSLEIDDSTALASAHVNETCGKQMSIGNIFPDEVPVTIPTTVVTQETEKVTVKELRERAASDTNRYYSKRKIRRVEPPALGLMY